MTRLLVACAQRIRDCLREGDTAARLGGDEFAVLLEFLDEPDQGLAVTERLREALRAPVSLDEHECRVRASIGLAFPSSDADAEQLRTSRCTPPSRAAATASRACARTCSPTPTRAPSSRTT